MEAKRVRFAEAFVSISLAIIAILSMATLLVSGIMSAIVDPFGMIPDPQFMEATVNVFAALGCAWFFIVITGLASSAVFVKVKK